MPGERFCVNRFDRAFVSGSSRVKPLSTRIIQKMISISGISGDTRLNAVDGEPRVECHKQSI